MGMEPCVLGFSLGASPSMPGWPRVLTRLHSPVSKLACCSFSDVVEESKTWAMKSSPMPCEGAVTRLTAPSTGRRGLQDQSLGPAGRSQQSPEALIYHITVQICV